MGDKVRRVKDSDDSIEFRTRIESLVLSRPTCTALECGSTKRQLREQDQ